MLIGLLCEAATPSDIEPTITERANLAFLEFSGPIPVMGAGACLPSTHMMCEKTTSRETVYQAASLVVPTEMET